MILEHTSRRIRAWGMRTERRRDAGLASNFLRARSRIARRRRTLSEIGLAYVAISLLIASFAPHSELVLFVGCVIYIAFGYMIWTVLENAEQTGEGNGFRLMTSPTRWRRNGVNFLHGLGILVASMLFAAVWMAFVMLFVLIASRGAIRFDIIEPAHIQIPMVHPLWTAIFIVPALTVPVIYVHKMLLRRAKRPHLPTHSMHATDRILWGAVIVLCFFFYVKIRGLLAFLPFPVGPICSSLLALFLTMFMAAFEIGFMEERATRQ